MTTLGAESTIKSRKQLKRKVLVDSEDESEKKNGKLGKRIKKKKGIFIQLFSDYKYRAFYSQNFKYIVTNE